MDESLKARDEHWIKREAQVMRRHCRMARLGERAWVQSWSATYAYRHPRFGASTPPKLSFLMWLLVGLLFVLSLLAHLGRPNGTKT